MYFGQCQKSRRHITGNLKIRALNHFKGNKHDIALLRLNESVPLFAENRQISAVSPVCLPWSEDDFARSADVGDKALVTGWGRVDNNIIKHYRKQKKNRAGSRILLKVRLPIVSETDCKNADRSFRTVDGKTQICAGAEKGMFNVFSAL